VTADCKQEAQAGFVCGVSTEAKGAGQPMTIQTSGVYVFPDGTFSQMGTAFLGTNGAIVTTIPSNAKFVQPLGTIVSSTKLILDIDEPILL
jgi:hypothetical protein